MNKKREMFSYIKVDTTGFEDKIVKAWNYYERDIKYWVNSFNTIYKKYYVNNEENNQVLKIYNSNKNIQKLVYLYNKKVLDPMNMFMFINSTNEKLRNTIVNELTDAKEEIIYNFFGVPHYGQTPAITKNFNSSDIENVKDLKRDKELDKLASSTYQIKDITEDDLKTFEEHLEKVCKKYCKNGIAKITSALYYINPHNFIPINKYTTELFEIPKKYDNNDFIDKYIDLCKQIRKDEKEIKNNENLEEIKLFPLISSYAFYSKNVVAEVLNNYENTKNIILTGAPGTGKTYSIKTYLKSKLKEDYNDRVCFMQFHPSIDYSDFIEGIKPSNVSNGNLNVKLQNGIFKEFCKKAFKNSDKKYYFVIDEINRANLSTVFGEILNAVEYRIKFDNNNIINPEDFIDTQYKNIIEQIPDEEERKNLSVCEKYIGKFGIPDNLYLLATMNDIDKSIDSFDLALRRRFIWIEMNFDENIIRFEVENEPEVLTNKAKELNKSIVEILGDKSYQIGHAYFLHIKRYQNNENPYIKLWEYHLEPLLKEYMRTNFASDDIEKHLNTFKEIFIK